MKKILIVLFFLGLSGCATLEEPQKSLTAQYLDDNWNAVKSGSMKHSDYYKGAYEAMTHEDFATKGQYLLVFNDMINTALKLESNKITKEEFDSVLRESNAKLSVIDSEYNLKMQEIEASKPPPAVYQNTVKESDPLANWPMMKSPKRTTCTTYGNQTTCETN